MKKYNYEVLFAHDSSDLDDLRVMGVFDDLEIAIKEAKDWKKFICEEDKESGVYSDSVFVIRFSGLIIAEF